MLQSYLDGEADPDTVWLVARHLSRCEACFADADTVRAITQAVAQLRVAPDGDVLARLRDLVGRVADEGTDA